MQVKGLNQSILALPSWSQFLMRSTLVGATLLLSSALIMAIAANWLSWPKVARIALLELTVIALVLTAGYVVRREPKGWATAYSLSSLVQGLAAVSVGGLLALIGQSYQTGADPWQLFALWAVLIMPWAFGLGSLFIILLVVLLTNLALFLFIESSYSAVWNEGVGLNFDYIWLVLLNGCWVALSQGLRQTVSDPHQLWFRLSLALVVASAVAWCLLQTRHEWLVLTLALGALALCAVYSRRRLELWNLAVFYGAFFVVLLFWLIHGLEFIEGWHELLFFPMMFVALVLIRDLRLTWGRLEQRQAQSTQQSAKSSEPWVLRGFVLLVQGVVLLLFLWLIFVVWSLEPSHLAYVYLPMAFVGMVWLLRGAPQSLWLHDLPLLLFGGSLFFMVVLLSEQTTYTLMWVSVLVVYCCVLYMLSAAQYLLRLGSAVMALGLGLYAVTWLLNTHYWEAISSVVWGLALVWLTASVALTHWPSLRQSWQPVWWAMVAWLIIQGLLLDSVDRQWSSVMAAAVPVLAWVGVRRTASTLFASMVIAGSAVLSFFWLFYAPLVNLALGLWLLSYAWQQSRLLWFALGLLGAALGQYYYFLDISLIQKAVDLGQGALLLGLAAWLLHRQQLPTQQPVAAPIVSSWGGARFKAGVLYGGLALVIAVTTWSVARKEWLLTHGQELILALAPVDPRSLMQGDYMALRFEVGEQVGRLVQMQNKAFQDRELLVYMQPQGQEPALLLGLENPSTGQFWQWDTLSQTWLTGSDILKTEPNSYPLRFIYTSGSWLPNGVDAWFFPEGEAYRYEQARYGIFKVNRHADALLEALM